MDDRNHKRDESELEDDLLPVSKKANESMSEVVEDNSPQERPEINGKVFNDPVHGHVELHPLLIKIIDTPQFQRLRYIKQLGGGYYVFPGASHNRFEHSIGVSHLAGEFVESLRQQQQPKLNITDRDVLCVKIAGLCHDLGHGPFSHLFDGTFIPLVSEESKWKHEEGSILMLEHLIETNNLWEEFKKYELCDQCDLTFIEELIDGRQQKSTEQRCCCKRRDAEKGFLYEIVANKRNSIDVDKFDYFARDSHGLGIQSNFDHKRYMKFARVIKVDKEWQICCREKEVNNLYDLFYTRNRLHRAAYKHKTTLIVEIMIAEALEKANDHLSIPGKEGSKPMKMSEAIYDPHAYTNLNDSIIFRIMLSTEPELAESRKILRRLQERQLYKYIEQAQVPNDIEKSDEKKMKKEMLDQCSQDLKDCLIVKVVEFDYGMGEENPIDKVMFYSKENPNEATPIKQIHVSQMLPEKFKEKFIFVFCKNMEKPTLEAAYSWFEKWCEKKNECLTPEKRSHFYNPLGLLKKTHSKERN